MPGIKIKISVLAALFVALFSLQSYGQDLRQGMGPEYFNNNPQTQQPNSDPFATQNEEGQPQDTTKKKKRERKPLESYFFDNATRAKENFAWNVSTYYNQVHLTSIDTLLYDFNLDYPFLKNGVGDAYLGNQGAPSIPLGYYARPNFRDFQMAQPLYSYLYTVENAPFYNVKRPFTQLGYITGGSRQNAQENIRIMHAQNISPSTGFNVTYHTIGTRGIYVNQTTRDTDFSLGFNHTGKRYSAYAGYIFNTIRMKENGGVIDDYYVTDIIKERPFEIPFMINSGASNILKNNTFYTIHTYGIPLRRLSDDDFSMAGVPAIYIGYLLQYDGWNRLYRDNKNEMYTPNADGGTPEAPEPTDYLYKNWYFNPEYSQDSTSESKLTNRLFVQLQPWNRNGVVGTVNAGIGMDAHRYYQFQPGDYLNGNLRPVAKESYYVYGSVEGKIKKYFDWGGQLRYVPLGYRQNDFNAEANARLNLYFSDQPVSLSGRFSYSLSEPSYWSQTYYSNHYIWNNSFKKENETRFEVKLEVPGINAEAAFYQSVLTNKVYFGPDKVPVQNTSDIVSVTGAYARKDFRIGGLHLNHRVLLQWSNNQQVVPVPFFSAYLSYFFEFDIVRDVLRVAIGLDGRYNTKYYAFGYNPSTGQFYNQREKQIGGYPMIDLFVTAKWKRMRILLKLEHLDEGFFNTREYFQVLHYPLNRRVFKFGVSWNFYN